MEMKAISKKWEFNLQMTNDNDGEGEKPMAAPANVTSYAKPILPKIAEPVQLSNMVAEAISRIGETAAAEIEKQADDIVDGATFISNQLRQLAGNMREYAKQHGEEAAVFCGRMTSSYDVARQIAASLRPVMTDADEAQVTDMEKELQVKIPDFLKRAVEEVDGGKNGKGK